jgi:hypothetical protein
MKHKLANASQRAVVEMTVLIAWYSANAHRNCVLATINAKIKKFKSTNGRQDYRDL